MSNKLANWLPEGVIESESQFEMHEGQVYSTKLCHLLYYHFDESRERRAVTEMLLDPHAKSYYVMLRSDEIPSLSDTEIAEVVRASYLVLREKAAYDRIANFLCNPDQHSHPRWSQAHFQNHFEEEFKIGQIYTDRGEDIWRELIHQFKPYWNCETSDAGYVYCLHDQLGHYKLGITKQLDNRIKQLATQPPFEITLEFAFKVLFARRYEGYLHNKFKHKRLRGEWFNLSADDLIAIKTEAWFDRLINIPDAAVFRDIY